MSHFREYLGEYLCAGSLIVCFIGMVAIQVASPNLATLKKAEWQCVAHHQAIISYMLANNTPIPIVGDVCDAYGRKGGAQ